MFIRFFIYSNNGKDAKKAVNELFQNEIIQNMNFIKEIVYKKVEPYWKIDNMYELEVEVIKNREVTETERKEFLGTFSDKWNYYGNPIDEAITSETMEGINYIGKFISMVNIFY